jgi:hypothetical protein
MRKNVALFVVLCLLSLPGCQLARDVFLQAMSQHDTSLPERERGSSAYGSYAESQRRAAYEERDFYERQAAREQSEWE